MGKNDDRRFMRRAIDLALASEQDGNLPIGAIIVLDGEIIAEGHSAVLEPEYHPGRHAEIIALMRVDPALWPRAREMTCYTTLEPCVMCAGTLLLHGLGRVVFGAHDKLGGAGCVLDHLPPYYDKGGVYAWEGPLMPRRCAPLYARADAAFADLPVGRNQWLDDASEASAAEHRQTLEAWRDPDAPRVRINDARAALDGLTEELDDDDLDEVLVFAQAIFERHGYLKDLRRLEKLARRAGRPEALERVDEAVRDNLPDLWIKRALGRGDREAAVACWFEHEEHHRIRLCADELVEACDPDQVEVLISCRMSTVAYLIGRRKRRHYRRACAVLRKLRDELERAGALEYWRFVLEDIQTRYDSRPALLDEISRAGFVDHDTHGGG